jgi:hypothetical protein
VGKITIKGIIIGLISLLAFAILMNTFNSFIQSIIGPNDPTGSFILTFNVSVLIIGIGLVIWIIKDGLAGSREYENYV